MEMGSDWKVGVGALEANKGLSENNNTTKIALAKSHYANLTK